MINNNKVIAIIPARANSKGCPGKNYKDIAGKPLFMWSVEAALRSKYIDAIVISTNDPEVERITKEHSLYEKSIFVAPRPESLSGPESRTEWAIMNAYSYMLEKDMRFDIFCLLQPTSPARRNNLIDNCLEKMVLEKFDSILTVTEKTPFFWNLQKIPQAVCDKYVPVKDLFDENNSYDKKAFIEKYLEPERLISHPNYSLTKRPMRQELKDTDMMYHDNGNFYACYINVLYATLNRVGYNPALYVTPFFESLQIDTEEDFKIISKLHELYGTFI